MLVSRKGRAWRVTQCEDVSMSMSVKRYFIGNGEFLEAKVVYFFGMHKFYAIFLAYLQKKQYLCPIFYSVRNTRVCKLRSQGVQRQLKKTYAKHQKYSNHRTR